MQNRYIVQFLALIFIMSQSYSFFSDSGSTTNDNTVDICKGALEACNSVYTGESISRKYVFHYIDHDNKRRALIQKARDGSHVHVSFRGTESLADMKYNFDIRRAKLALKKSMGEIKVHRGFFNFYDQTRPDLVSRLKHVLSTCSSDAKVFISGHSLGGAAASIAAIDLAENHNINVSNVITLGAPKAFSTCARKELEKLKIETTRIAFEDDPVSYVSPFWYTHTGKTISLPGKACRAYAHNLVDYLSHLKDKIHLCKATAKTPSFWANLKDKAHHRWGTFSAKVGAAKTSIGQKIGNFFTRNIGRPLERINVTKTPTLFRLF